MNYSDFIPFSELARNWCLAMAGLGGALFAGWSAYAANRQARTALEQHRIARRDHVTDIFDRAVGKLGDDKLEVRIGAAYTLVALCRDDGFMEFTEPVMRTLQAYVRVHTASMQTEEMTPETIIIQDFVSGMTR